MNEGLEKLENEVTCPLCLSFFQKPKKLSCDHVYCKSCLERLADFKHNGMIECPECRSVSTIPNNNVNEFQTAFHINRLRDVFESFPRIQQSVVEPDTNTCREHPSQALAMYCETCQESVCRDCVLDKPYHKDHKVGYIDKISERIQEEIGEEILPMKEMEVKATNALEIVRAEKEEITSQGVILHESIELAYTDIVERLQKEKTELQNLVANRIDCKTGIITQQADALDGAKTKLREAMESIQAIQQGPSTIDVINAREGLLSKAGRAQSYFNSLFLTPCEAADVGVEVSADHLHGQLWKDNSYIYRLADPKKCKVNDIPLSFAEVNEITSLNINILDSSGKPCTGQQSISIELQRIRDSRPCIVQCENQGSGIYEIAFKLSDRGRYKLSITIHGNHIAESPYTFLITKPPQTINLPVKVLMDLKSPSYLACCENTLIISNHEHAQLTVIAPTGKREDINLPASSPTGATIDGDGNFYVCTVRDAKLHKLNKSGQRLKSTITGQFSFPNGLHLAKDGKLYVCDSNSDQVRVFNTELELIDTIPTKSVRIGIASIPVDVDTDEEGKLYIVEHGNQRIKILTRDGIVDTIIGSKRGSVLGSFHSMLQDRLTLTKPAGIKVLGDYIYVADWAYNCVSVFSKQGQLVHSFGSDILKHPEGLTIDDDGYVYVASARKEVLVF